MIESVLGVIDGTYRAVRGWIELRTLIPAVEGAMRIWHHLNPRLYSEQLRIRHVVPGQLILKSNRFVLFVLAGHLPLPKFTINAFEAIARTPLNLVIVFNGRLSETDRQSLLPYCHLLIERENLGRDFGGYKDGLSIIRKRFPEFERLILLNDSLYYFANGLDQMFAALDGEQDFIGLTEVIEFHYHVQSFMVSLSRRVLDNPRVMKYWRTYRPVSTRRWSIHKGEVGLTRCITKAGFKPYVIYHGAQLLPYLRRQTMRELLGSLRLLPTYFRRQLNRKFKDMQDDRPTDQLASIESITRALDSLAGNKSADPAYSNVRAANVGKVLRANENIDTIETWTQDTFVNQIITTITTRNQMHVGGFLFMACLGMPVIKRDIFYREVYGMEDVFEILTEFKEPLRDEVMADLRQKGTAANLAGFARRLYRHGSI